jgi:TPR repeat protein
VEEVRVTRTILAVVLLLAADVAAAQSPAPAETVSPPATAREEAPPSDAQARLDRARELIGRGEPGAAVPALREALQLDPDLAEARATLGFALFGMGDVDGAIEELRAAVRRHPAFVPARLHLATALMARQDAAAARAELEDVLRRRPDLLPARYALGIVRYTLGDLPGAIDAYRQVLAADVRHHDARFNLALTLKLAHRDAEATPEFIAAAEGGVPRAQYFLGTAYAGGVGVERNLVLAITWWFRAADGGIPQADEALVQMRRVALGRGRHGMAERQAAEDAFRVFRAGLWRAFPDLSPTGDESLGSALIAQRRAPDGLAILLREAAALGEPAARRLVEAYEAGVDGYLPAHDARILAWLRSAAAEGQLRPRIWLARIYAGGVGVPKDVPRAMTLLRSTPHEDAQRLLQELSTVRPD